CAAQPGSRGSVRVTIRRRSERGTVDRWRHVCQHPRNWNYRVNSRQRLLGAIAKKAIGIMATAAAAAIVTMLPTKPKWETQAPASLCKSPRADKTAIMILKIFQIVLW